MPGTRFTLEVRPRLPRRLARLAELADDLLYSWEHQVRALFQRLDPDLWAGCGYNPRVFLRRVSQGALDAAVRDRVFMEDYNRVLSVYDTYHAEGMRAELAEYFDPQRDLIAYFCAEFGFHESFPIYSGGLGILAGDHCKAASDLGLPFVAVGLLYRQGYFTQTIDPHGRQVAHYTPTDFDDLPIAPARDALGGELHVGVPLPGREVKARVWCAKAGRIRLYLLDTDLPDNAEADRAITYQLYGGDAHTRIQQEMVLGIGGVRALRALGLAPTVWHINEGHAAFQIIERAREEVAGGLDFSAALELVAAGTVFTTHTPVPAGHDIFDEMLLSTYFADYCESLGIDVANFYALGSADARTGFNMTTLALRGSRFHNGVSRIHGAVASRMEAYIWPQVPPAENPVGHVTNGVHVPTFLAREWMNLFDMRFREWRNMLLDEAYWSHIDSIPDHRYWSLRQSLKSEMLEDVRRRLVRQLRRNGASAASIARITQLIAQPDPDLLVLGFARRFAAYKRATLMLSQPERLARLLNDPQRPVVIIFAGKAHPHDAAAQQLIEVVHDYSRRPEFLGRILLLEDYNIGMARRLVTGVDVWINNPEYPMEASGTSGQKAAINGVINLSVLDGWWAEGYNGRNGWAIAPHDPGFDPTYRNQNEAADLLDILEKAVIPLYFDRHHQGYSEGWVRLSKVSMQSILPRFNSQRMVMDYVRQLYAPARDHDQKLRAENAAAGLAAWKARVRARWPGVRMWRVDEAPRRVEHGEKLHLHVRAELNGLAPEDLTLECLLGQSDEHEEFTVRQRLKFQPRDCTGEACDFRLDFTPGLPGLQFYQVRMYPSHPLLAHPLELGRMLWL